ncbi:MAG TPA: DivIVA domain-containing protein [Actinomycetes bacterium]|nr:DivIVA domain-containing protein [Actinomycetes bacterium]
MTASGSDEGSSGRPFIRALRGYSIAEVDAFVGQLSDELDRQRSGIPARVSASQVRGAYFTEEAYGYAVDQVDEYLERVGAAIERIEQHRRPAVEAPRGNGRPAAAGGPVVTPEQIRRQEFGRVFSGYAMAEVDLALDRITRELAALQAGRRSAVTAAMILRLGFPKVVRGYHPAEVHAFLRLIASEFARLRPPPPPRPGPTEEPDNGHRPRGTAGPPR